MKSSTLLRKSSCGGRGERRGQRGRPSRDPLRLQPQPPAARVGAHQRPAELAPAGCPLCARHCQGCRGHEHSSAEKGPKMLRFAGGSEARAPTGLRSEVPAAPSKPPPGHFQSLGSGPAPRPGGPQPRSRASEGRVHGTFTALMFVAGNPSAHQWSCCGTALEGKGRHLTRPRGGEVKKGTGWSNEHDPLMLGPNQMSVQVRALGKV